VPTSDWTPSLERVGALLRARTKDTSGNEIGTFSAATRPTDEQATDLILQAQNDVVSVVGAEVPDPVVADASYVTALGAALLVELSYFPEQIGTGRSPYPQLKELYDERLKRLIAAVEAAGGTTAGEGGTALLGPSYSFPMVGDPFIIGRRTAW
jgi:hypothetical protein